MTDATEAAGTKQDSKFIDRSWVNEFTRRINEAPQELEEYFAIYVPSHSDPPEDVRNSIEPGLFDKWSPTKGKEAAMYHHLVRVQRPLLTINL